MGTFRIAGQPVFSQASDRHIASGLGWFSFGLGIPRVLVPGRINKLAGLEDTLLKRQVMRLMGLREITPGVGIFGSQPKPAEWLWARTAGDAVDLLLLQSAFRNPANRWSRLMTATATATATANEDGCVKVVLKAGVQPSTPAESN